MFWLMVGHAYISLFFLTSGCMKLISYPYFNNQLKAILQIKKSWFINLMGLSIILLELLFAGLMLLYITPKIVLSLLLLMVIVFTGVITYIIVTREEDIDCGCFGKYFKERLDGVKIISNVILCAIIVVLILNPTPYYPQITHFLLTVTIIVLQFTLTYLINKFRAYQLSLKKLTPYEWRRDV